MRSRGSPQQPTAALGGGRSSLSYLRREGSRRPLCCLRAARHSRSGWCLTQVSLFLLPYVLHDAGLCCTVLQEMDCRDASLGQGWPQRPPRGRTSTVDSTAQPIQRQPAYPPKSNTTSSRDAIEGMQRSLDSSTTPKACDAAMTGSGPALALSLPQSHSSGLMGMSRAQEQ